VPLIGALYASLRPYQETIQQGFFSTPDTITLDNYRNAWDQGNVAHHYWNTALILVPALIVTLFFSSMVAFVCSRFSWRFNIFMLSLFTAGNLLPQQIIIQPLYQFYNRVPLPDWLSNSGKLNGSTWGIILIHIAFQSGFCTFVLSNYMKLLPKSLNEAARIDGAGVWKQYWQIIMPLTLPALDALATLEFTWIYNDFFWAVVLEQQGADRPITSSLANLGGEFFSDDNLIAAASVFVALPTLIVYFALQRYFISGLTIGAEKG
jgi:multiple sugar transport system permease protein